MADSPESSSPSHFEMDNNNNTSMNSSSPALFSPNSEERFWSNLRNRVDTLLENRKLHSGSNLPSLAPSGAKRLRREDCVFLLRGFDSVSSSLSQLTSNLNTAVQGARELAKPTFTTETIQSDPGKPAGLEGESKRGVKRRTNSHESSDDQDDNEKRENEQGPETGKLKRAKNLAVSMATKAATLARELKSIKSDLCFMQDRCSMLEEENRRLRDGYEKEMRPEEDDLVRLQLEALLAEKSRLANENANLTRENECLHQLVEYHQLTSQVVSASYEQVMNGTCQDFSSPPPTIIEECSEDDESDIEAPGTPHSDICGFSSSLDGWPGEEQQR